jgi:thioredoxin reductase
VIARDVVILGAGPAGLAAAAELKRLGLRDIAIIDRETEAGGVPRHCGHTGYGLREFHRLLTGPEYASAIAEAAGAASITLGVTALGLEAGGIVQATGRHGTEVYRGKAVLLAMGARETPRSARLVSGTRPWGVITTGALQQFIYLHNKAPFRRPVVIGTELVSFSTLVTMRHLGIKPVAMIEANARITARRPGDVVARAVFGVPVLLDTQLVRILGKDHVEGIEIDRGSGPERLDCDGVIFTGQFRPENALLANSPIAIDRGTLGPAIDQYWRCSDPAFFAAGNLLRGVETAGQCWREGRAAARAIAAALEGKLPTTTRIPVQAAGALKYVYPQRIAAGHALDGTQLFKARVQKAARGTLVVRADDNVVWSRRISALPERRLAWPVSTSALQGAARVTVTLEEA